MTLAGSGDLNVDVFILPTTHRQQVQGVTQTHSLVSPWSKYLRDRTTGWELSVTAGGPAFLKDFYSRASLPGRHDVRKAQGGGEREDHLSNLIHVHFSKSCLT